MPDQRLYFSKKGTARYMSHLDLMRTFQRAFQRAGIGIRHTEGYHPHPYVSIPLPLPLGFSSECEILEFGLLSGGTLDTVPALLNDALPPGVVIHCCYHATRPFRQLTFVRYQITLEFADEIAQQAGEAFLELVSRESCVITKRSKKAKSGYTELDLIPLIQRVENVVPRGCELDVTLLLRAQNPGLNPDLLISAFRTEYPALAPSFVSFLRKELFDENELPYETPTA